MTVLAGSDVTGPGDAVICGVIGRLRGEFHGRLELNQIARVVHGRRTDLNCSPSAALPELIEGLRIRVCRTARHAKRRPTPDP